MSQIRVDTADNNTLKLNYSTLIGSTGDDVGRSIKVETNGDYNDVYITGWTDGSDPFPAHGGSSRDFPEYQDTRGGGKDAFILKLNTDPHVNGSRDEYDQLVFSSYFGGSGDEIGWDIVRQASNIIHIVGETASAPVSPLADVDSTAKPGTDPALIPITTGAAQTARGGTGTDTDAFVAKFTYTGGGTPSLALNYSTYIGGSGDDKGYSLDLDSSNQAWVTGETASTNFPLQEEIQTDQTGTDAFVTQLKADGTEVDGSTPFLFSTYFGGAGADMGYGLDVLAGANKDYVYFGGETSSTDTSFPETTGTFQTSLQGTQCGFVAKITQAPPPPENVQASDGTSPLHVVVTWDTSNGASRYEVYRCTTDDDDTSCGTAVDANVTVLTYNDEGAVAGTKYYYRVKAANNSDVSAFSDPDDEGWKQLAAPTAVSATDGGFSD